ncbi:hypothetical protein P148_SR1C00001G0756 [candidate division SR1 bacterium RAAC1_SR1_1]|nr:hypothetical protein P148_SR1C00001G0756 [candidate division SR1 bacterium RAAC1_SR1_1]
MNLIQCEQQLQAVYDKNPILAENISKITNTAWGADKSYCIQRMGGVSSVKNFLFKKTSYVAPKESDVVVNQPSQEVQTTTGTSTSFLDSLGLDVISSWGYYILWGVSIALLAIIFTKFIRKLLHFCYDVLNAPRMIYLKVMFPRNDGKSDREQQKELAKDMKEKIGRMSQVFHNVHKLGELSTMDSFLHRLFYKPKVTLIYHYEDGQLSFIMGVYPEYQKILEGAISAQYSDCSIERIETPKLFKKKYYDIMPLVPKKNQVYNIRIYKQMSDDPINNIIDAMGKISQYDTVSIVMPIKPVGDWMNKKAQKWANGLYRNDKKYTDPHYKIKSFFKYLNPFTLISMLISGPKDKNPQEEQAGGEVGGKDFVRMVKAKEDYLNSMGEEASLPFYQAGLMLISSSDNKQSLDANLDILTSSYNVYGDEYGNEFCDQNNKHDVFGFFFKPMRKFAALFGLTSFFFSKHYFGVNELASLFHFPDNAYNRSPAISWMQYKVLPAPENLPVLKDFGGYIIDGKFAENYKNGSVSSILEEYPNHRAVGTKTEKQEKLTPVTEYTSEQLTGKEIVEKDGHKFVKEIGEKQIHGYKVFKDGVLLGANIYRNNYSPVYMKREDRTRHHYCIGKSGTGKSVFLQTMARQDIWNGDGICLIDPHGDLAEDVLAYIPKERAKDVIYFDAGNEERPMGLNLYEISNLDEADRVVNDATEIFLKMFGPEIFGPRLQEYFKYGSLTLLEDFDDRPTLLDVVRLFTDESYREYKCKKVTNATVRNWRDKTFASMGDREKQEIIPYLSAKFVSFNTNRLIRNIIGQTKSAFTFEDVMNNRKILIINLSKGRIGELNAQLLGMIIVSKIYTGAMARAKMPEKDRKDFYLYVDEFQNFVSGTFADILSEARKYRLCLIMAHQYIAQLEPAKGLGGDGGGKGDVKAAVFGNVGTMQSFKVGAPDAEFLEKEYAPVLSGQDIVGIANYKAYIKLNIDNSTTRVFSMNAIYTKDYQNLKIVPILKEYSSKKYGRKREFVDAEMAARLGVSEKDVPAPAATPEQVPPTSASA